MSTRFHIITARPISRAGVFRLSLPIHLAASSDNHDIVELHVAAYADMAEQFGQYHSAPSNPGDYMCAVRTTLTRCLLALLQFLALLACMIESASASVVS